MDRIEIDNQAALITLEDQKRDASFFDLTRAASSELSSIIYPPSVRHHTGYTLMNKRTDIFILEEPPKVVRVKWKMRAADKKYVYKNKPKILSNNYSVIPISVPYTVFCLYLHEGFLNTSYAFFRKSPLKSLEDPLLRCPLLNVNQNNYSICMGDFHHISRADFDRPVTKRIYNTLKMFQSSFWQMSFNYGLNANYKDIKQITPISKWAEMSAKDSNYGMSVDWPALNTDLRKYIGVIAPKFQPHYMVPIILQIAAQERQNEKTQI